MADEPTADQVIRMAAMSAAVSCWVGGVAPHGDTCPGMVLEMAEEFRVWLTGA